MKAVMPSVLPEILEWRKRTGQDRWDEMWEGVLHMPPAPNAEHQDLEGSIENFIRNHLLRPRGIKVYHNVNLASPSGWPQNYRIPDLILIGPKKRGINLTEYFEGAPDVVVEIKRPGDETEEKLHFYAGLGVPEVWVIDRDTKEPRILILKGGLYEEKASGPDGWLGSDFAGIDLRGLPEKKLALRLRGDDSTAEKLPPD